MHRRDLLLVGAGVLAAKATASAVACATEAPEGKAAADKPAKTKEDPHAGHEGHEGHTAEGGEMSAHAGFVGLAAACVGAGNACIAHCLGMLATGDKSMGDCGKAVAEMLPVCEMVGRLAAMKSAHLSTAAKLCFDACSACAKACKPHVKHHKECKACFEACTATVEEAKKHFA